MVERFEQKGSAVEAIQVKAMRKIVTCGIPRWQEVLPAWLVDAINTRIIGICWNQTQVAIADGGAALAAEDDWLVRMPDGTLQVYTDAAFLALYRLPAPVIPAPSTGMMTVPGTFIGGTVTFTDLNGVAIPVAGQCPTCGWITCGGIRAGH